MLPLVLVAAYLGHVRLIHPPATSPSDFLDRARSPGPCGVAGALLGNATVLPSGVSVDVTWHIAYAHWGGYRLQILNITNATDKCEENVIANLTDVPLADAATENATIVIPSGLGCGSAASECALRLTRTAAEWGDFDLRSCSRVIVLDTTAVPEQSAEAEVEADGDAAIDPGALAEPGGNTTTAAEPEPEAEAEVEVETEAEGEVEPEVEAEAEAEVEPQAEPEAEAEAEAEAQVEAEPEAEAEAEPEAEAEAEVEAEAEAEPEAEVEAEVEAEAEGGAVQGAGAAMTMDECTTDEECGALGAARCIELEPLGASPHRHRHCFCRRGNHGPRCRHRSGLGATFDAASYPYGFTDGGFEVRVG